MSNYRIITDENKLKEFIDWLPELGKHEKFYVALLARRKFAKDCPSIKSDKAQLKRLITCKDRLFDKIKQMECPIGSYRLKGQDIPQEALGLYINVNPRNLRAATLRGIGALAKLVESGGDNYNPHAEMLSQIQKCASDRRYVVFDFDSTDELKLQEVLEIIEIETKVIRTRGGFHIFVPKEKVVDISDKMWYKKLIDLPEIDQAGDLMSPVVGSFHGGHTPKFL